MLETEIGGVNFENKSLYIYTFGSIHYVNLIC